MKTCVINTTSYSPPKFTTQRKVNSQIIATVIFYSLKHSFLIQTRSFIYDSVAPSPQTQCFTLTELLTENHFKLETMIILSVPGTVMWHSRHLFSLCTSYGVVNDGSQTVTRKKDKSIKQLSCLKRNS